MNEIIALFISEMQLAMLSHNSRGRKKKFFNLLIFVNFVIFSSGKTKFSLASCKTYILQCERLVAVS